MNCDVHGRRYLAKNLENNTFTFNLSNPTSNFGIGHLIAETWKNGEFAPALFGRLTEPGSYYYYGRRLIFVAVFLFLYGTWFCYPSWLLYYWITAFFLAGTAYAKMELAWQFLEPVAQRPELREMVPDMLYLWAREWPF